MRVLVAIASVFWLASCSSDPVTANRAMEPGDELAVRQLTPAEDREALAAMKSVVHGDVERPTAARHGMRFSDVPEAVRLACTEVDMAIVRHKRSADSHAWTFEIVTVRDEPGEMVVERRPPPQMMTARATVGLFHERTRDAAALVEEFNRIVRALGAKPGWEDPEPPSGAAH